MLAAQGRRPGWAGLLVGLAVATKPWALIAVPAVIAVLPEGRRRAGAIALAVPGAIFAPFVIAQWVGHVPSHPTSTGDIFKPWQLWWPLGSTGTPVVNPGGGVGSAGAVLEGYRHSPSWLSGLVHPGIVALSVPLVLLWARRRRAADGLLLLAFLLFLRCLLDPWNNVYYVLPCVLALVAFDASRGRAPLAAARGHRGDVVHGRRAVLDGLARRAVRRLSGVGRAVRRRPRAAPVRAAALGPSARRGESGRAARGAARHSTIVSSFGYELRTSRPSSVTTTRSSMRTPKRPGR